MLVALTILAIASTSLFGWVFQISGQIQRLNNQQTQAMAQLRALRYLNGVNPAQMPQGRQEFTDFVLSWDATAATPLLQTLSRGGASLPTRIGVFDVKARLTRVDRADDWVVFETQLPGWTVATTAEGGAAGDSAPGISGRLGP